MRCKTALAALAIAFVAIVASADVESNAAVAGMEPHVVDVEHVKVELITDLDPRPSSDVMLEDEDEDDDDADGDGDGDDDGDGDGDGESGDEDEDEDAGDGDGDADDDASDGSGDDDDDAGDGDGDADDAGDGDGDEDEEDDDEDAGDGDGDADDDEDADEDADGDGDDDDEDAVDGDGDGDADDDEDADAVEGNDEDDDEDEDADDDDDTAAVVAEADLGSSARCKAVVEGATPGTNPCHIGCGGSNPVQDNPNWWAWNGAKGFNPDPSSPIENNATMCPDGRITSKGLYISQSLPGYDDLKWCGFCFPWGGESDMALAKLSGAATCQQLGDADNKDHFVCSTAVVAHVMWTPSSMGILVSKRVLCEKGHCTTSKVGLCIDVRQPVYVPALCDDANHPKYNPNATICTSVPSFAVNSFLIKDEKAKNLKFANLAVAILEQHNNNITGTEYQCAGSMSANASNDAFTYPDLAQKTIALK